MAVRLRMKPLKALALNKEGTGKKSDLTALLQILLATTQQSPTAKLLERGFQMRISCSGAGLGANPGAVSIRLQLWLVWCIAPNIDGFLTAFCSSDASLFILVFFWWVV